MAMEITSFTTKHQKSTAVKCMLWIMLYITQITSLVF